VHVRVSPPSRRRAPRPAVLAASRGPGGWWRPGEGAHRPRDSLVREPCSSAAASTEFRTGIGPKRAIFRPFLAAGGAKTRSAPQLRSAAGGDVLFTCPGRTRGGGGVTGARGGGKTKIPLFGPRRYHSITNEIVQYVSSCSLTSYYLEIETCLQESRQQSTPFHAIAPYLKSRACDLRTVARTGSSKY